MIEDIVTTQAAYALRSEYTREAGYAIARDIDNAVLALRASVNNVASQVIYNSSNGLVTGNGAANPLTFASFLTAKLILDAADVPPEDRVFIVSPGQYAQLLNINQFTNVQFIDGRPVENGLVGSLFGIPVVMTSQVGVNSNTGYVNGTGGAQLPTPGVNGSPYVPKQDTYATLPLIFSGDSRPIVTATLAHMDWAVLGIQQEPQLESGREPIYQADVVIMTQLYGTRLFRSDHAVLIHSINTLT
jgi:Phage capsid protein